MLENDISVGIDSVREHAAPAQFPSPTFPRRVAKSTRKLSAVRVFVLAECPKSGGSRDY